MKKYYELSLVSDGTPQFPHFSIMLGEEKIGSALLPSLWKDDAEPAAFYHYIAKMNASEYGTEPWRMARTMARRWFSRALIRQGSAYRIADNGCSVDKVCNRGMGRTALLTMHPAEMTIYVNENIATAVDVRHIKTVVEMFDILNELWSVKWAPVEFHSQTWNFNNSKTMLV